MSIKIKDKKVILVDYFDTSVYRCVSSNAVLMRWAELIGQKFDELKDVSAEEIFKKRAEIKYNHRNDFDEVPIYVIYEDLRKEYKISCTSSNFCKLCLEIEEYLEMAVQIKNESLINWIKHQKEQGKKVYIVSDSHFPLSSYNKFLKKLGIDDLFDGVFASAEVNATKRRDGARLYHHVLQELDVPKDDVIMIGDNADSDLQMSKIAGIGAILYKRKFKNIINYSNDNFFKQFIKHKLQSWKGTLYFEYAYMFFIFISRLHEECLKDGVKKLSFLSRDGYFLKKLFDKYQELFIPQDKKIESLYCYNSRLVNKNAMEDGTSRAHFVDYMKEFIDGDHINVVDCGWNNSSQQNIQNIMKIKTRGYYIGTFSKENLGFPCKREGLIYDIESNGDISDYYWLLRTNFTLIEQLCGAPEGSVCDIKNKKPIQHWQQQEKYIYKKWIAGLQENIADEFLQLCAWLKNNENAIDYELLAKINVKSGLFADERRLQFLNELSENYFDNFSFGKNTTGNISFRKAKPSLRDRLIYPEKRLSILVKKQRGIKTKFGMFFYKIWANLFYFKLTLLGKFNKKKQNNHCKNTKKA